MHKYLLCFVLLIFVSCKSDKKEDSQKNILSKNPKYLTEDMISKIKFEEFVLDKKAQIIAENWSAYQIIVTAIDNSKRLNYDFFIKNDEEFNTTFTELNKNIPEAFDTQPIKARLLVLQTQMYRLKDELAFRPRLLKDDVIYLKEVYEAFSNLNLLINKKLEREAQIIEKPE